ncbi:MFS transporter [Georgenia wangjunii]|uniref:MFS transporter n=1 Tax=Georgenia wangjunii TaxID=3117730 RepID=UPI002F2627E4
MERPPAPGLTPATLALLAVATGLLAGGNYLNQPLLAEIAQALDVSDAAAGRTVTVAQVAYALGLALLVPLGDRFEQRNLAALLIALTAVGHTVSGFATTFPALVTGIALAAVSAAAAQVLVPMAAALSDPVRQGRTVGIVMSGLVTGTLVARAASGALAELGDWHTPYRVVAVLLLAIAAAVLLTVPKVGATTRARYGAILASVVRLLRDEPRLRTRGATSALTFASISALWATMTFLLAEDPHMLSPAQIGLVTLAGVIGAQAATVAGHLADRGFAQRTTAVALAVLFLSWAVLVPATRWLAAMIVGFVLIDAALQAVHLSSQNVVYSLVDGARSRLNAAYMTTYFAGGALGSWLGVWAWSGWGWPGVCVVATGLAAGAVVAWLLDLRAERAEGRPV